MVMEGYLDEHEPMVELEEANDLVMRQVAAFHEAAEKVEENDYTTAIEILEASGLPDGTRQRLVGALESGEYDMIDTIFAEFKGKLGQAFCDEGNDADAR